MNKTPFLSLQTTKLGTKSENFLINEFVKSKGYHPFTPSIDGSHPIDCLAMSGSSVWALDIKCKSRRKYFQDTGADTNDIDLYMTYGIPVYILWADIVQKKIYGNFLSSIIAFRKDEKGITYFPLDKMIHYRDMTEQEYNELKELERSKYY